MKLIAPLSADREAALRLIPDGPPRSRLSRPVRLQKPVGQSAFFGFGFGRVQVSHVAFLEKVAGQARWCVCNHLQGPLRFGATRQSRQQLLLV
jgi:hypothetical protein